MMVFFIDFFIINSKSLLKSMFEILYAFDRTVKTLKKCFITWNWIWNLWSPSYFLKTFYTLKNTVWYKNRIYTKVGTYVSDTAMQHSDAFILCSSICSYIPRRKCRKYIKGIWIIDLFEILVWKPSQCNGLLLW